MSTTTPGYGELWEPAFASGFRNKSNSIQHFEREARTRAIACVNACAGMADPAKEIQAMREALSGRTVSCSNCNETARQLEAMREAVKDLRESLEVGKDSVGAWDWCNSALTKLQPLLKT